MGSIEHHRPTLQPEKNNYEISQQDRSQGDKDMFLSESDLAQYLKRDGRRSQAHNGNGDLAAEAGKLSLTPHPE